MELGRATLTAVGDLPESVLPYAKVTFITNFYASTLCPSQGAEPCPSWVLLWVRVGAPWRSQLLAYRGGDGSQSLYHRNAQVLFASRSVSSMPPPLKACCCISEGDHWIDPQRKKIFYFNKYLLMTNMCQMLCSGCWTFLSEPNRWKSVPPGTSILVGGKTDSRYNR